MGCKASKETDEPLPVVDATAHGSEIIIESEDKYDKQVINYIKDEIRNRPERFLLNNLLMSMIFFRNYEKELYDFSNTAISKEEQELNSKLVTEVKKCILSDALLDKIQENIKFYDEDDRKEEHMSHETIYVVNNNIEVKDKNDTTYYTPIDVPGCHVEIEELDEDQGIKLHEIVNQTNKKEEKNRKGFLKLRVAQTSLSKMKPNQISNRNINKKQENLTNSTPSSPQLENCEDNSDEYSVITAFNTPKSLNIVKTSYRRDTLPDACFAIRKIRKLNLNEESESEIEEAESEEETDDSSVEETPEQHKKQEELYENVTYLSSKGFMEYFQNEVFPNTTGKILGFSESSIEAATALPGCILCFKNQRGENIPFKVIPSVAIEWPLQATEFIYRKSRNTIIDKRDGIVYRWPTNEMVRELRTLNCVVIPKGFVMKKGENEDSDIEWEIHFPKAARYLEMRMSHPQVRCYIFLLTIYKTYIEKFTTYHGLLIEHLRTHMFWECESDAKNWPEHKMGTKILQVIEDLNSGLSRSKIPHYFIKEKNIFENIPSKYLQFAQKVFHDVLQFPVMHFIEALKSLKYVQPDYYPAPDLDQLYRILAKKNIKIPSRQKVKYKEPAKNRRTVVQVGSQRLKQKQRIEDLRWKKKNEKHNRKKYLTMQKEKEEKEAAEAAKNMEESSNLKFFNSNLDVMTQTMVIEFFIKHFIEIAMKSRKIGPKNQTLFYLKQAWYNLKVLEDIGGVCEYTVETDKTIIKERESLERDSLQDHEEIAPPTPQRNVEQNIFAFHSNTGKPGLIKKHSTKVNTQSEVLMRRDKRLMRTSRQKSVGFDDNVEKISIT